MGERLRVLVGEQETGWRGPAWFSGLFFLGGGWWWQGDLRHQRGSYLPKVSESWLEVSLGAEPQIVDSQSTCSHSALLPVKSVA